MTGLEGRSYWYSPYNLTFKTPSLDFQNALEKFLHDDGLRSKRCFRIGWMKSESLLMIMMNFPASTAELSSRWDEKFHHMVDSISFLCNKTIVVYVVNSIANFSPATLRRKTFRLYLNSFWRQEKWRMGNFVDFLIQLSKHAKHHITKDFTEKDARANFPNSLARHWVWTNSKIMKSLPKLCNLLATSFDCTTADKDVASRLWLIG